MSSPNIMASSNMVRPKFPKLILLKGADNTSSFSAYMGNVDGVDGSILDESEIGAFNPLAKIETETSISHGKYTHLRFTQTNKYWGRNDKEDGFLVAVSKHPVEDTSDPLCTLFEVSLADKAGVFHLTHVHSGGLVTIDDATKRYLITNRDSPAYTRFSYVDFESICNLPRHVAFQGDNDMFLRAVVVNKNPFLKFDSFDPNDEKCGYEVFPLPSGHVRIKSNYYQKWWKLSPAWIWGNGDEGSLPYDPDTLFWPVKYEDNTIALKNVGIGRFCKRLSAEYNYDCLNAATNTVTTEAKIKVHELVVERKIIDVYYDLNASRVYDEHPEVAGSATTTNQGDKEAVMNVEVEYTSETSYTVGKSTTYTGGVTASFGGGFLKAIGASVEVSYENSFENSWESASTSSTTLKTTVSVPVPPRSTVIVNYMATKGKFSVPYSYTQRDKSSTTGEIIETRHTDGVYNGANNYNFHFVTEKAQEL